jgi:hypothetical protein
MPSQPITAPPLVIYMQCKENAVENDYEGGLLLFTAVRAGTADKLVDARVVLSCKEDALMRDYPVTREEKQGRFFRVTVEEVPLADLPPDPDAPKVPSSAELLQQAHAAAIREGNTELAAAIASDTTAPALAPA